MAKRKNELEQLLKELDQVACTPFGDNTRFAMRRGLMSKHGIAVGKAARVVAEFEYKDGIPDLLKAFDRLLHNAADLDPGCLGKIDIIKALRRLKAYECPTYLCGIRYRQFESDWGGKQDRAAQLRAECALALAEMGYNNALLHIGELLADPEIEARVGAAQALSCFAGRAPAALLRLRALSGEEDVRVLEEIFSGLFAISFPTDSADEEDDSVRFVGRFLESSDVDVVAVAAISLGSSRKPLAFQVLREFAENSFDEDLKKIAFEAIAILRLPEAFDYTLDIIARGSDSEVHHAEQAMSIYHSDERLWDRVEKARATRIGEGVLSFLFDD